MPLRTDEFKRLLDPKLANDCLQGLREVALDGPVCLSGQMSDSGELGD